MATTSGILVDTTLEGVKQWVSLEATQAYERQIGTLDDANKQLGSFQSDIEARVKGLQDSRIPLPSQDVLFKEAVAFVETYDRLYIEALKAQKLAGELSRVMEFLTPRVIVDEATMKKRGGDLAEASRLTDEACKKYIASLKDCQGTVHTLQEKMLEEISLKTTSVVQNFREIADRAKRSPNSWSESITSWFVSGEEKPVNFTSVGDKLDEFRTEKSPLKVADADPIAGQHPLIDITLEVLKQEVFNEATQAYKRQIGSIQQANKDLGSFERDVRKEASPLQNSRITIPSQATLLKKAVEFVRTYDRLYIEAFKAQKLAGELQRIIEFLTPRTIVDEMTMNAHGGQLAKVSQLTDAACREYITSLRGYQGEVDTLQKQMVSQILGATAWSVQRFCQIVDNEGRPLGLMTRMVDKYTWAAVPEEASLQAKLDAVKAPKDAEALKTPPSSPALNSFDRESPAPDLLIAVPSSSESQSQGSPIPPAALPPEVLEISSSSDGYDKESPKIPEVLTRDLGTPSFSGGYGTGVVSDALGAQVFEPISGMPELTLPNNQEETKEQVTLSPVL